MSCVVWTYAVPAHVDEATIRTQLDAVAGGGRRLLHPEWIAGVTERWGAAPVKTDWEVPVVAESADGRAVSGYAETPTSASA